jgi:hypothetical protein
MIPVLPTTLSLLHPQDKLVAHSLLLLLLLRWLLNYSPLSGLKRMMRNKALMVGAWCWHAV